MQNHEETQTQSVSKAWNVLHCNWY